MNWSEFRFRHCFYISRKWSGVYVSGEWKMLVSRIEQPNIKERRRSAIDHTHPTHLTSIKKNNKKKQQQQQRLKNMFVKRYALPYCWELLPKLIRQKNNNTTKAVALMLVVLPTCFRVNQWRPRVIYLLATPPKKILKILMN